MQVSTVIREYPQSYKPGRLKDPTFSFNFVPEIEDEIFEYASWVYPHNAHNFSTISKRIQRRVEPIIYKTLVFITYEERFVLRGMTYAERFYGTLVSRPTTFFATNVHDICITNTVGEDFLSLLLYKCTGVRNLAIWQDRDLSKIYIVDLIIPLSTTLSSLSTGRSTLQKLADAGYVFSSLTNLSVGVLPIEVPLTSMDWLPALRTVSLRFGQQPFVDDQWWQDVHIVLSTTARLQRLFVDVDAFCLKEVEARISVLDDQRICVRDERRIWDPIVEWTESFTWL